MVQRAKRTKAVAIAAFALAALVLWLPTITHNAGGFIAPTSAQAIGFDAVALLVWAAFLYAAWNLLRAFRGDLARTLLDRVNRTALDADTAKRLVEKHGGDWNAALADAEDQGYRISRRWRGRASG